MAALYEKYDFQPIPRTHFYKWVERNSFPIERWLEAEYIAIKEGVYKSFRKAAVITKRTHPEPADQEQEESPSSEVELL